MRVAIKVSGSSDSLYITKAIHSEEELNAALNFFRDCKAEIDGEEIATELDVLPDKIKLVNFLNWGNKE